MDSGCQGLEEREGWIGGVRSIFIAVKLFSSQICIIIYFSKLIECTTTRVNPKINYELSALMIDQSRLMDGNKCTMLVEDVCSGGGCVCWGRDIHELST